MRVWCLCALLVWMPPAWGDSAAFESLLDRADALRSADATKFVELLGELDGKVAEATLVQRQRLRFLHCYRKALSGDFDGAIVDLRRLFDETTDVTLKFRTGTFLANTYAATREFAEGLGYLDRTLALLPDVPSEEVRQQGLIGAAVMYNQVGQHDLALHHADAILAAPATGRARCMASFMRIEALFNRGDLRADDEQFSEQIAFCQAQGEVLVAGFIRGYQARKWAAEGRHAEAAELLRKHLPEVESTKYPRLIGEIYSLLAEYELANGAMEAAERYARAAIEQSRSIEFSLPLVMAHRTLYESALKRRDIAGALEHYRSYAEADKAFLDATKARELAVQLVKQETEQKNQTIELLNKRNQVLQLEQQVSKQATTNTQLVLALVLLLLASITFWAYKTKRMQVALKHLAETDGLTGISNRRHFTDVASELIRNGARQNSSLALIMFDLDHFKRINDHYGHATGDWVLRQVATSCRPLIRRSGTFGRIGGEEFAVILADSDIKAGRELALRLRERIGAIDARENGGSFDISASFGVSATALSGYSLDRLMAQADEMMYASKQDGRNRVSAQGDTFDYAPVGPVIGPADRRDG